MLFFRSHGFNNKKHLCPPPAHISNVLAHLRILLRETDRAIEHEPDKAIRKELRNIKLYGAMLGEKVGQYWDLEDQV